jgi:hypothetical protein
MAISAGGVVEGGQLGDATAVATALEAGVAERPHAGLGDAGADDPGAQRDHVGVVVGARRGGGERLGAQRAAHARHLVGGDADADAGAADDEAQGRRPRRRHRATDRGAVVGIVDRLLAVGAEVGDLVAEPAQQLDRWRLRAYPA